MREKSSEIEWDFSSVCTGARLDPRGPLYCTDGSCVSGREGAQRGERPHSDQLAWRRTLRRRGTGGCEDPIRRRDPLPPPLSDSAWEGHDEEPDRLGGHGAADTGGCRPRASSHRAATCRGLLIFRTSPEHASRKTTWWSSLCFHSPQPQRHAVSPRQNQGGPLLPHVPL